MEVCDYRITEGSDYGWNCYGPNTYCLTSWNGDHDGYSLSIIFDTKFQTVYEVQAHDYKRNRAYRLIHLDCQTDYREEALSRDVDPNEAWDTVSYVDLETVEDFLEKIEAIVADKDYDTRISVPVDFTDEELLTYMKIAHERDITFNQLVEEALRHAIEECQRDPEGMKAKADQWKAAHVSNTDNPIDFPVLKKKKKGKK